MTTEPIYHFVKGVGWVPGDDYETRTAVAGGWHITVSRKPPVPGDCYYGVWKARGSPAERINLALECLVCQAESLVPKKHLGGFWGDRGPQHTLPDDYEIFSVIARKL